jgi:hypothetical protein
VSSSDQSGGSASPNAAQVGGAIYSTQRHGLRASAAAPSSPREEASVGAARRAAARALPVDHDGVRRASRFRGLLILVVAQTRLHVPRTFTSHADVDMEPVLR